MRIWEMFPKLEIKYKDSGIISKREEFSHEPELGERFIYELTNTKTHEKYPSVFEVKFLDDKIVLLQELELHDIISVLHFGSQYADLFEVRCMELGIDCETFNWNTSLFEIMGQGYNPKGFILSGGPYHVYEPGHPVPHPSIQAITGLVETPKEYEEAIKEYLAARER